MKILVLFSLISLSVYSAPVKIKTVCIGGHAYYKREIGESVKLIPRFKSNGKPLRCK